MSSEESLSTRLRPGVTTKMGKSKASTNLQDDLMRLIDPDIAESDLASILVSIGFWSYIEKVKTNVIHTCHISHCEIKCHRIWPI